MRTSSGLAQKPGGMTFINHDHGPVLLGQVTNFIQLSYGPIHGKSTIGDDEFSAGLAGLLQLQLQIGHVIMPVTEPLRLTQTDTVDNRRMV